MSVVLTRFQDRQAVEIADAKGEVFPYRFAITATARDWSITLTKLDPVSGEALAEYVVRLREGHICVCECPDFRWRFRANRPRLAGEACKHLEAARELYRVWREMTGVAS
jgi:hypothetical protein